MASSSLSGQSRRTRHIPGRYPGSRSEPTQGSDSSILSAKPNKDEPIGLSSVAAAGLGQGAGQLVGGELLVLRGGVAAGQLGDGGELARGGVRLDAVPGAQQPDQLGLGGAGEPVLIPGGGVRGQGQGGAGGLSVQRHPGAERG